MDREEALAVAFANLKGEREKDVIAAARALAYLKQQPGFGTNARVGEATGVSGEVIREFLSLLRLPESMQSVISARKLSLEHGRRLAQLARHRPDLLDDAVDAISPLTAHDARHLIDFILNHPELTVEQASKRLLESKTIVRHEYHVVAILDEEHYKAVAREAAKRSTPVNSLVSYIVRAWLMGGMGYE